MTIKRTLSIMLALCVMLTALFVGMISASAEEPMPGSWEFSDIAADNVTADQQTILTKALDELDGANYKAVDVIATQTVAGTNYAFLCIVTPVVPNAQSHWAIVTVYADLQGNTELVNISDIDASSVQVKENIDDNASGGWQSTVKDAAAPVPANVQQVLEENIGLTLSPIAVLGTQTVAGTNYCILAYGTLVTADPVTNLYQVIVYAGFDGTTEITSINPLDLAAYVTAPVVEDPTEEPTEAPTEAPTQADNGSKSPKTGYADTVAIIMLLMVLAAAGIAVSVSALSKKRG